MIGQIPCVASPRMAPPQPWLAFEHAADEDDGGPITFGNFQIWPRARKLLRCGECVELRSRAFDLLVALLKSRGRVVSKDEIVRHVWPTTTVDESNIRLQVATLRRALGDDADMVQTIPGRGYLFVEEMGGAELSSPWSSMTASSGANGRGSPSLPNPTVPHQGEEVLPKPAVTPTIVVIDRSSEARDEIRALLEHVGYEVQTYASVEDYKSARRSGDAGCIILDVWSPGHSGLGLAAAVAAFRAGVPIIFVGAHADVHIAVQAMKAGATDFLTKPVRHLELLEAVKQATADHDRAANPA